MFRKDGYLSKREQWFYEGKAIEVVNSYTYLGFTFTTMLSAKHGTNHLVTKGRKAVYHIMWRAYTKCKEMSQNTFFKIFDSKVQSILLYSSEIWGLQRLDSIEKACKRYLGVPIKTPNKMIYGELGRSLFVNSNIRCIKYWLRILQMEQNWLPKQAYQMLLLMDEMGKKINAGQLESEKFWVELVFILYDWTRVLEILKVFSRFSNKGWLILLFKSGYQL